MDQDKSWLTGQLPEVKQKAPMWREFADAVQELFDMHIKPVYQRIEGLSSFFSMQEQDLRRKIGDLGKFFYFSDAVDVEDLPLAIMQRLDEVHFKRTDLLIHNAIVKEFKGVEVEWTPLYAPIAITPVGSDDYTKEVTVHGIAPSLKSMEAIKKSGRNPDEYFLTSRGVIKVNVLSLLDKGFTQDKFVETVNKVITPIIPLEIVFNGADFFMTYTIIEPREWLKLITDKFKEDFKGFEHQKYEQHESSKYRETMHLNNNYQVDDDRLRFDDIALDSMPLDIYYTH